MLHSLTGAQAATILPLMEGKEHLLLLAAVVAGTAPGRILVDDPVHPRAAFAAGPEGHYVLGDPAAPGFRDALRQEIIESILPRMREHGYWYFTLNYERGWEPAVADVFGPDSPENPLAPVYTCQRFFTWAGDPPEYAVPAGMSLLPVHDVLQAEHPPKDVEHLRGFSAGDFGSPEGFLASGYGVCLVQDHALLGWCTTDCVVPDAEGRLHAEIGIHVRPGHRGHGLGHLLARAMLAECRQRGVVRVGWHCFEQNLASANTALGAGMQEREPHAVLHCWLSPVDGHVANGNLALMLRRYGLAAEHYARAFLLAEAPGADAPSTHLLATPEQIALARYHAALASALDALPADGMARRQAEAHLERALATGTYRQAGY